MQSPFNPDTGIDIDRSWIDMNEPSGFCNFPCDNPFQQAIEQNQPPPRSNPPPDPNTPIFLKSSSQSSKRDDRLNPPNTPSSFISDSAYLFNPDDSMTEPPSVHINFISLSF
ncbi:hypothetical protein BYT27DRAFT_7263122 [Phlegmacium glaucopus]|nr:hypothetical protein BYT27DRAFT_7263122 [Phlegmacium glaucopus]